MPGPAYLATSLAPTWTSLQAIAAAFPIANLTDGRQAKICRLDAASATWRLTGDLGTAKAISVIAICNHDLPAGTTIEVRKSSDNFAANDVQVMAPTAGTRAVSAALTFAPATERYWRLNITQPSSRVAQIGEIFMGQRTDLIRNFSWGYGDAQEATTVRMRSDGRSQWLYGLGTESRLLDLTWTDLKDSERDELLTMWKAIRGRLALFVLLAGNSTPTAVADQDCLLCSREGDRYGFTREVIDLNVDGTMTLVEDGLGVG